MTARAILAGTADGPVIATTEPLSFWGGIDPATGCVIDVHHPLHGRCLTGAVVLMPSTRGSCTGSGVLLDMALSGRAPAALVFSEAEDVVTLGALIAAEMFGHPLPVLRLSPADFAALAAEPQVQVTDTALIAGGLTLPLAPPATATLDLTANDRAMLDGAEGPAAQQAMRIICAMAAQQGASRLIDVTQGHIDGCIYASPANLTFAQTMADMGAKVRIPTTMNAISVDRANWQRQGVPPDFGGPAARLADAYVTHGLPADLHLLALSPGHGAGSGRGHRLGGIQRGDLCQFGPGRAHRQAPGFP
jgi:predicted aconitase with swiveling domain